MKYRAEIPPRTLGRFMGAESCSLGSGRSERASWAKRKNIYVRRPALSTGGNALPMIYLTITHRKLTFQFAATCAACPLPLFSSIYIRWANDSSQPLLYNDHLSLELQKSPFFNTNHTKIILSAFFLLVQKYSLWVYGQLVWLANSLKLYIYI